ncbi:hypothetical protein ACVILK_005128 [Bradyrhizobium embrapense]
METVGQPLEVGFGARLDQAKFFACHALQCRARRLGFSDQQARHLAGHLQDALRDADVDDERPGRKLRLHAQGR